MGQSTKHRPNLWDFPVVLGTLINLHGIVCNCLIVFPKKISYLAASGVSIPNIEVSKRLIPSTIFEPMRSERAPPGIMGMMYP